MIKFVLFFCICAVFSCDKFRTIDFERIHSELIEDEVLWGDNSNGPDYLLTNFGAQTVEELQSRSIDSIFVVHYKAGFLPESDECGLSWPYYVAIVWKKSERYNSIVMKTDCTQETKENFGKSSFQYFLDNESEIWSQFLYPPIEKIVQDSDSKAITVMYESSFHPQYEAQIAVYMGKKKKYVYFDSFNFESGIEPFRSQNNDSKIASWWKALEAELNI